MPKIRSEEGINDWAYDVFDCHGGLGAVDSFHKVLRERRSPWGGRIRHQEYGPIGYALSGRTVPDMARPQRRAPMVGARAYSLGAHDQGRLA